MTEQDAQFATAQGSPEVQMLDPGVTLPRPYVERAPESIEQRAKEVVDYIRDIRARVNVGGPAMFEQLDLSPYRPGSDTNQTNRYKGREHCRFLDGDTEQEIFETHQRRKEALTQQGLIVGTSDYDQALYDVELGERAEILAHRIIPGDSAEAQAAREERGTVFKYIVDFWERAIVHMGMLEDTGGGLNLASRPFMAPTGRTSNESAFEFNEQYRWDSYFQNLGLVKAGDSQIALSQLENKVDVLARFKLIPNALTTAFLSHGQPPVEVLETQDLLEALGPGEWYDTAAKAIEQDLWNNWLDAGAGSKTERQAMLKNRIDAIVDNPLLTRHTNVHINPILVGCEDGKDHYEINLALGVRYLPVQLNAILHGHFEFFTDYYATYADRHPYASAEELTAMNVIAEQYRELTDEHRQEFQRVFWDTKPDWEGFRNYGLEGNSFNGRNGCIRFDDLSAEVFPLRFGLATPEQAKIIRDNIFNHYAGDQGLAATGFEPREGRDDLSSFIPVGIDCQWTAPNCWPPLMEMAATGLERYGFSQDAGDLRAKWVKAQDDIFRHKGYFFEKMPFDSKYDKLNSGLYGQVSGGFGWTIGVYLNSLHKLYGASNQK